MEISREDKLLLRTIILAILAQVERASEECLRQALTPTGCDECALILVGRISKALLYLRDKGLIQKEGAIWRLSDQGRELLHPPRLRNTVGCSEGGCVLRQDREPDDLRGYYRGRHALFFKGIYPVPAMPRLPRLGCVHV